MLSSQMYSKLFRPWDAAIEQNESDIVKIEHCKEYSPIVFKKDVDDLGEVKINSITPEQRLKRTNTDKGKLRKIRNHSKDLHRYNSALHQDSTISTTTDVRQDTDKSRKIHNDQEPTISVQYKEKKIQEINERLGHPSENKIHKKTSTNNTKSISKKSRSKDDAGLNVSAIHPVHSPYNQYYPEQLMNSLDLLQYSDPYSPHLGRHPNDLLTQAELAQSLGIPPTDPLLLESLAQGYAMEIEYARILHQENQTKLLNSRKQRPKKYRCPHCNVGFSNNGQLKGHIRIHTGERPFKCDDTSCGKTFTRNEELTRHRRIHSGLRPYPCQTCGKKFGRRDHLKKHTKTHLVQAERMMPMFVPLSAIPTVTGYPYLYGY